MWHPFVLNGRCCGHKRPYFGVLVAALTLCFSSSNVSVLVEGASSSTLLRSHCDDDSRDDTSNSATASPPGVTNFALIDVVTNQTVVASLEDNFVLNLTSLRELCANGESSSSASIYAQSVPPKLTIRVDAEGSVYHMVMDWDHGSTVRTSRRPPFALAGVTVGGTGAGADDDSDVNNEKSKDHQQPPFFGHSHALTTPGTHSLQATPFDWQGRAGRGRTLHLQVILGGGSAAGVDALLHTRTKQETQARRSQDDDERRQPQQQQRPNNSLVRPPSENERQRRQLSRDRNDDSSEDELPHRWNGKHNMMTNRKIKIQIIRKQKNATTVSTASAMLL